jgi:hypothetical protein
MPSDRNQYRRCLTTTLNRKRSGTVEFQVSETFFFHITSGGVTIRLKSRPSFQYQRQDTKMTDRLFAT